LGFNQKKVRKRVKRTEHKKVRFVGKADKWLGK